MNLNPYTEISEIITCIIKIIKLNNKIFVSCKNLIFSTLIKIYQFQYTEVNPQIMNSRKLF